MQILLLKIRKCWPSVLSTYRLSSVIELDAPSRLLSIRKHFTSRSFCVKKNIPTAPLQIKSTFSYILTLVCSRTLAAEGAELCFIQTNLS